MLETKAPIIPVFYEVKPSELRWTEGKDAVYSQALQNLKEKTKKAKYDPQTQTQQETLRHDSETVEQWRNALSSVAGISGFELEACNSDQGELLEKVVECVLRIVKKTPALNVAKYPTGLDEKVKDFENKILKSQVVGIVGLRGVGKTTLAKELFNLKSSHYKNSCFLADVRDNVAKGCLTTLQSNLLERLLRSPVQIDNKDQGIEELKKHLSSSEILVILDDVDKVDQVDALLPDQTSLHSNSLILITSRNKDVLANYGVEESSIYKLDGFSEQNSLELFCCHAFNEPYRLPGFESLTQQFINACQGLPLSLKVFLALLRGKNDKSYWRDQLASLKNILPSDIEERLKISYDALNTEEKQIFLDIACFLIGHDRDKAISIWDASGWKGTLGLQNLQSKCLVEVEVVVDEVRVYDLHFSLSGMFSDINEIRKNKIKINDHLRDLGRNVAGYSCPCCLWRWTENGIDDLLQQSRVITVRGIRMVLSEYHDDDELDSIEMRRLQLLDTEGFLLERILRRVKFPNLIWLCWENCPYSSLPSCIPVKNLRVLEVSGSTLETLWQQESQLPVCLEELRVNGCRKLKSIKGLEQAKNIQRLNVRGCSELEELWGLEQVTKLKSLDVSRCYNLEELPSMEKLVSLETLRATDCCQLKRIQGLEQATELKSLDVSRCYNLEELPSMEKLVSLETLRATDCCQLKRIQGLEQATELRYLDVSRCRELEELPSLETLVSLEQL